MALAEFGLGKRKLRRTPCAYPSHFEVTPDYRTVSLSMGTQPVARLTRIR